MIKGSISVAVTCLASAMLATYCRGAVNVMASRDYVDRRTSVSVVTNANVEGYRIGSNSNFTFAAHSALTGLSNSIPGMIQEDVAAVAQAATNYVDRMAGFKPNTSYERNNAAYFYGTLHDDGDYTWRMGYPNDEMGVTYWLPMPDYEYDGYDDTLGSVDVDIASVSYVDKAAEGLATLADGMATHSDATNAARAVSAPLEDNVGVLWQFVFGETVWLAVTNYMRTAEGVKPSLELWEVRDGATNCVYSSREEITNIVDAATAALRVEVTNAMPDKAWSRYQSATGAENPQPTDITIVSTPRVMLTGGGEWNRYVSTGGSAVWVLHSNGGLTTFGDGTNSFFRVEDDEGKAQFEVSRTNSHEVDALTSSIGFSEGNFQVTYKAPASGNQPVLYAATNLTSTFTAEEEGRIDSLGITVNWGVSGGLWRATIEQDVDAPALFVHAKVLQEGSVIVKHHAPTSLDGGLYIDDVKYRIVPATISGKTVLTLEVAQ